MKVKEFIAFLLLTVVMLSGCGQPPAEPVASQPSALKDVSAVRLNYRYEADVPPPEIALPAVEELNAAVRDAFQQGRPEEILDRTLTSPDKKRVLAIYHQPTDLPNEFRLDMYSADGQVLRRVIADNMAVHFPDTIVWSPDSANVAFVAMLRGAQGETADGLPIPEETPTPAPSPTSTPADATDSNSNTDADTSATPEEEATPTPAETPAAPVGVLAFRSEQLYMCDADGGSLKLLTQNEGLMYFYYVWSPDGSMLAALAATVREWQVLEDRAKQAGQVFTPLGRPRLIEKNGRERRLDDGLTAVRPVWSPDSAKVAAAFEAQVRIYDADGTPPTQAAIPLRNDLLLSSQAYDKQQESALSAEEQPTNADANNAPATATVLPDPSKLVSFNPIVALEWQNDQILYFQTAYIKRMLNEAESVTSFARWHRLILSPQAQPVDQ